jgi:hypothetical protein
MCGCFNRLINVLFALLVIIVLAGAAAYYFLLPRLDTLIADAVRREFILPPTATVIIQRGSLFDTLEGQVRRFHVESSEAKIEGVVVNDLKFDAKGIRFDLLKTIGRGQAELQDVAYGELELKISEASIEERWAAELKRKGLSKVEVQLQNDRVNVSGLLDIKLAQLRVGATGKLAVDGNDTIKFKPTEIDLGGANFQVAGIKAAITGLTPVIDLGQFKVVILVDQLQAQKGYLLVKARSSSLEEHLAKGAEAKANERKRIAHEKQVLEEQLRQLNDEEQKIGQ